MPRGSYEVHVKNIPKFIDPGSVKKILKEKVDVFEPLNFILRPDHCFISFPSSELASKAADALQGAEVRGRKFKIIKRWERIAAGPPPAKRQETKPVEPDPRITDPLNWPALVQDSATPLWRLSYEEQLAQKNTACVKLWESICGAIDQTWNGALLGGLRKTIGTITRITPCPKVEGGRNKAEFTVGRDPEGKVRVGFRVGQQKTGTAFVLPVDECRNIPELMKRVVRDFQEYLVQSPLPPFDTLNNMGFWRQILVRVTLADIMVAVTVNPKEIEEETRSNVKSEIVDLFTGPKPDRDYRVTSVYYQELVNQSDAAPFELLDGAPYIYETLFSKYRFRISPDSFFQTNTRATEMLYSTIAEVCALTKRTLLLDICSGTGSIGICLADKVGSVLGVEIVESAVRDANETARVHGLAEKCTFVCEKAEDYFQNVDLSAELPKRDCDEILAVLDPPRAGLPDKIIMELRKVEQLKRLCYVSCDPKAAQKNFVDLCRPPSNRFAGNQFKLVKIVPDDMFPLTALFEWVILFER